MLDVHGQAVGVDVAGSYICKHNRRWFGCPGCRAERTPAKLMARWRVQNPDKAFQQQLNRYGVTVEWYNAQERKQRGCCDMCGQPETTMRNGKVKRLAVDHDHETDEPRALLCYRCNVALGVYEEVKAKAEAYLAKFKA